MSTSSRYSVADGAIARHAAHLDGAHASMNTALRTFESSLAGLPAVWRGASYASFHEVQTRWEHATTELNRALADIRTRVSTTAHVYDTGQSEQAAAIRQVDRSVDWSAGTFRN